MRKIVLLFLITVFTVFSNEDVLYKWSKSSVNDLKKIKGISQGTIANIRSNGVQMKSVSYNENNDEIYIDTFLFSNKIDNYGTYLIFKINNIVNVDKNITTILTSPKIKSSLKLEINRVDIDDYGDIIFPYEGWSPESEPDYFIKYQDLKLVAVIKDNNDIIITYKSDLPHAQYGLIEPDRYKVNININFFEKNGKNEKLLFNINTTNLSSDDWDDIDEEYIMKAFPNIYENFEE